MAKHRQSDGTIPSHPFGDLVSQHLSRRHGLNQRRLAKGIDQTTSVISMMCKGERLTGTQARPRVLAIINWLYQQEVLTTYAEADQLLEAAGMNRLRADSSDPYEQFLVQTLDEPATATLNPLASASPLPTETTATTAFDSRADERLMQESHEQELFATQYMELQLRQFGFLNLGGVALHVQGQMLRVPLNELFVAPSAESGISPTLQTQFVIRGRQGYEAIRIGNVALVGLSEITLTARSVILGTPGAGKSTLLRWFVLDAVRSNTFATAVSTQSPLPLFVRLTHVAQALLLQPGLTLDRYLRQHYAADYRMLIDGCLESGRLWLLLDGLDEIVDRHMRWQVGNLIEHFAAQFPTVERIAVTSRVVGYRSAQLSNSFRHFTLQPFGPVEIGRFLHNWYRIMYRLTQASVDDQAADQRARRLINALNDKPRVLQLAGTPLFLTLIALMDWKGKDVPRRRVELYEAATKTLLEDWPVRHGRPVQEELTMDEMLSVLAQLALKVFKASHDAAIRQDELETRIADEIRVVRGCSLSEAVSLTRRWLSLLSEHSGLLLDAGVDTFNRPIYMFLHLSFVEYLCGRALAAQWRAGTINLVDYVGEPRWHEVILLMAGFVGMDYATSDSARLVESILTLPFPHQDLLFQPLVLAATCLADDVQITPVLRERILEELVTRWYHSPPSRLKSKLFRLLGAMRGTDSAPTIIRMVLVLDGSASATRSSIIELLGNLGSPGDEALKVWLLAAISDIDPEVQRAAIRAIGMMGLASDPQVRTAVLAALHHESQVIRARAVLALAPLTHDDPDVRQALLDTLAHDQHDEPRRMAARVLGAASQPAPGLLDNLIDGSPGVRKEAMSGFIYWDMHSRQRALTLLRQVLCDPDLTQRVKMVQFVAEVGLILRDAARDLLLEAAQVPANLDLRMYIPLIQAFGALPVTSEEVLKLLVAALIDGEPKIVREAAIASGDTAGTEALPLVRRAQLRIEVATALRNLGAHTPSVIGALTVVIRDPNPKLRRAAVSALGTCGLPDLHTVRALDQALADSDELVKLEAARSLLALGIQQHKAQEMLVALLHSSNKEVRRLAIQAVQNSTADLSPAAIAVLVSLAVDPYRDLCLAALRALSELGLQANADVRLVCRTGLQHEYPRAREAAAEALGRIGCTDEDLVTALLNALEDPVDHVRLAASNALVAIGQRSAHEMIIDRVRKHLDARPHLESALNTLWELIVGE